MSKPLAIRAAYSDLKLVKTRQVAQLIFEIPVSEFDAAYEVLGGLPAPDSERWFAIAAIKDPATAARPEPVDQPADQGRTDAADDLRHRIRQGDLCSGPAEGLDEGD